jgi:hypothetical protein
MRKTRKERKPLPKIKCGDSNCADGLHIYRAKRKKPGKEYEGIPCRECGDDSIDWENFRKRDLSDSDQTFTALKKEYIRNVFWNIEIDKFLQSDMFQKGLRQIECEVKERLIKVVKACGKEIFRDGTQTPLNKHNIIFFAQHATATCCRKCIQIWHNIPYDKELDESDIDYLENLIMLYIKDKAPDLQEKQQLVLFNILEPK